MAKQLKNIYTYDYISNLANKIGFEYVSFQKEGFLTSIFNDSWKDLELKQRMRHIAICLNEFLPLSYKEQLEILKKISKDFYSFEAMFFQDFVEVYGMEDFENSLKALEVFTIGSSSEFAIRAFILKYEDKTMGQMKIWAKSENEEIRRLSCEGCRPRLPWGVALPKFKKDPTKVLEIIEILKNDKSKYVQKSVANNLNDISKDNPNKVIDFVKKNLGKTKELDWICKHGSRTLLKKSNEKILNVFGLEISNHIDLINFKYDKNVKECLNFSFDLLSNEILGNLRIEYEISYLKLNGTYNKKRFMISQNFVNSNMKSFSKKQQFIDLTTRKHYFGKHYIAIVINGKEFVKKEFILNDASN